MDFGLSDDQQLLEKTLRGYLAEHAPITRVRELREAGQVGDPALWKGLSELGMAGVMVPEAQGGSGLGLLDAALVAQSLGHAASPTPFLATGVMAPVALAAVGGPEAERWLAGIATGDARFGAALVERFSVREDAGVREQGGKLHGKALMAVDALGADFALVWLPGDDLAVVRGDAAGLEATRLATLDVTRDTSELVFDGVAPEQVYRGAGAALDRCLDAGRVALAADALGACESMLEQAVAYAQQREQFGRPIGSFQAVKHLCAEMVAEIEPARSLLWYAAHAFEALPDEAPQLACHVLSHVSEIGREIASVATQVHGGIGWTDEQNLHFWFKRIAVARHLLGGPELLRERAAALQGLV